MVRSWGNPANASVVQPVRGTHRRSPSGSPLTVTPCSGGTACRTATRPASTPRLRRRDRNGAPQATAGSDSRQQGRAARPRQRAAETRVSPSRSTAASSTAAGAAASVPGIGLQFPAAQVGGDLLDRLVSAARRTACGRSARTTRLRPSRRTPSRCRRSGASGSRPGSPRRPRAGTRSTPCTPGRAQAGFGLHAHLQPGVEVEQRRAVARHQAVGQRVGEQLDVGVVAPRPWRPSTRRAA